jgi:hypothetical protein
MGLWVRPRPRGGFAPPFPRSALGVHPEDPFRVAQRLALDPSRWSAVEGGCPLQRRVWCRASEDFPPHAAHPAEGGVGGLPSSRPAPAPPGKRVCPHPTAPARPGQGLPPKGPAAQGTLISIALSLPIACNHGIFDFAPFDDTLPGLFGPNKRPKGRQSVKQLRDKRRSIVCPSGLPTSRPSLKVHEKKGQFMRERGGVGRRDNPLITLN